jgi:hypothetical protein
MKIYSLFYEFYPFNVENMQPKKETVEAESLDDAIQILYKKYGRDKIEVFEKPAREFYNE